MSVKGSSAYDFKKAEKRNKINQRATALYLTVECVQHDQMNNCQTNPDDAKNMVRIC